MLPVYLLYNLLYIQELPIVVDSFIDSIVFPFASRILFLRMSLLQMGIRDSIIPR